LQKRTRSVLDELDQLLVHRDPGNFIESRASHVISGAINLIGYIRDHYDKEIARDLERRLINSIKSQDPEKFRRGVRKLRDENK
jgi:hypothetical protein